MQKIFIGLAVFIIYLTAYNPAQAQCPKGRNESAVRPDQTVKYNLPKTTRFYIKIDNALSSGVYKTGDFVKFSVLENVFGYYRPTAGDAAELKLKDGELITVIPKGAQGFGRINFAKRRTPFYILGKAKIYVLPEYVRLDDGKCIAVKLPVPDLTLYSHQRNIKPCKYKPDYVIKNEKEKPPSIDDKNRDPNLAQCIQGHRPNIAVTSGIVGAVAGGALTVFKDDATGAVAGLTLINGATSGAGISDVINGANAEIPETMIYEVELLNDESGFTKSEPPKKEDPKPAKP